jgi:hypothetical protein
MQREGGKGRKPRGGWVLFTFQHHSRIILPPCRERGPEESSQHRSVSALALALSLSISVTVSRTHRSSSSPSLSLYRPRGVLFSLRGVEGAECIGEAISESTSDLSPPPCGAPALPRGTGALLVMPDASNLSSKELPPPPLRLESGTDSVSSSLSVPRRLAEAAAAICWSRATVLGPVKGFLREVIAMPTPPAGVAVPLPPAEGPSSLDSFLRPLVVSLALLMIASTRSVEKLGTHEGGRERRDRPQEASRSALAASVVWGAIQMEIPHRGSWSSKRRARCEVR